MKTAQRLTTAAIFFTALALATPVRAQTGPASEPVLKAIPDDALGFVLINHLDQTDKAISKLAATAQAPVPGVLSLFKLQAGIQEGLDENGSAAVALLPGSDGKPLPVALFPVTDYKKFIAQFHPNDAAAETTGVSIAGHALIAGHKGSFALFTLPDQKERLAKMIASTEGVDTLVESVEPWIGRHQISLVATPTGSKMLFQAGAAAIKQFGPALANLQGKKQSAQIAAAFKMYSELFTKASEEADAFGSRNSLGRQRQSFDRQPFELCARRQLGRRHEKCEAGGGRPLCRDSGRAVRRRRPRRAAGGMGQRPRGIVRQICNWNDQSRRR